MIVLILIAVILAMLFTGRSGNRAYTQAVEEEQPVQKGLYLGEFGCMPLLFAAIGAMGVFMALSIALPGK